MASYLAGALTVDSLPALVSPNATEREKLEDLDRRHQLLKTRLDVAALEAARIDRMMTLLLALTAIYGLALGLHSYFGVQQVLGKAKTDAARKEHQDFREEIHAKYPQFADLHANLRDLIAGMNAVFPMGVDWTEHAYALSPQKPEQLLITELRVAGLEAYRLDANRDLSPPGPARMAGTGPVLHLEVSRRAEPRLLGAGHLDFQMEFRCPAVAVHFSTDFAVHLLQVEVAAGPPAAWTPQQKAETEALRSQAELAFQESLAGSSENAGALFGLGYILYARQQYRAAIEQYSKARRHHGMGAGRAQEISGGRALEFGLLPGAGGTRKSALILRDLQASKAAAVTEGIFAECLKGLQEDAEIQDFLRRNEDNAKGLA